MTQDQFERIINKIDAAKVELRNELQHSRAEFVTWQTQQDARLHEQDLRGAGHAEKIAVLGTHIKLWSIFAGIAGVIGGFAAAIFHPNK